MKFEMGVIVSSFYWCCPCFKRKKKKKTDKQKSEKNVTFKEYSLSKEFASEEHIMTEIQTMSKVRHENIISLEDYFIIGNHCYLIMELATAGSLDEEIKRTGPLSEPKAKNNFIQMVNAINHLHNEHI